MPKEDALRLEAKVVEARPNAMFVVELENGHRILAHVSGKMRMNFIRILPGDRGLALDLLVAHVGADHPHLAVAADDTALLAHATNGRTDLHGVAPPPGAYSR